VRIGIDIDLGFDRIRARLRRDGTLLFDDPALIALGPPDPQKSSLVTSLEARLGKLDRRPNLVGIGAPSRWIAPADKVLPVVSRDDFQPTYAAAVARYLAHLGCSKLRPGWRGVLMPIDSLDVSVAIEGYQHLSPDDRRELVEHLRYERQIRWLVG
jgi:hypothetical protein